MNPSKTSDTVETSLTQDLFHAARYHLGGRRGLILLTVAALGVGAVLNWSWVVAAGVAPLLLCAGMCALGLCMKKGMGRHTIAEPESTDQSHLQTGAEQSIAGEFDAVETVTTDHSIVSLEPHRNLDKRG